MGACASAALWTTQFAIEKWYPIPIKSLAEITESSKFYYTAPVYPSEGLYLDEICKYLSIVGIPFHTIEVDKLYKTYVDILGKKMTDFYIDSLIEDAIKAYLLASFPIICMLRFAKFVKKRLKMSVREGFHAVVISGYREENGEVAELYVHDDQIGPYCKTKFLKHKMFLENEWIERYDKITIDTLVIPVDPLIRLSFTRIYEEYLGRILEEASKYQYEKFELFISNINSYKEKISSNPRTKEYILLKADNEKTIPKKVKKEEFLLESFPKYLWVITFFKKDGSLGKDILLDATKTLWYKIAEITYTN